MEIDILHLVALVSTFVSGGLIWEIIKFFLPDLKKYFNSRIEANKILNSNIDPILKSADELFGKLTSLAQEDFNTFVKSHSDESAKINKIYVYYLFAQFWARLELLKIQSDFTSLSRLKKGKNLLRFVTTYEARKNRILDRSIQRLIGESLIIDSPKGHRIMTLYEFNKKINEKESSIIQAVSYLDQSLHKTKDKSHRQRVLIFGIILCSLIDYFDKKHSIVRKRDIYINKLSNDSKIKIKDRIMGHYLDFMSGKQKYYEEKKGRMDLHTLKRIIPFGHIRIFSAGLYSKVINLITSVLILVKHIQLVTILFFEVL